MLYKTLSKISKLFGAHVLVYRIDVFDHTGTQTLDNWNEVLEFPVRSVGGEIGQGFVDLPTTFTIT